MDYSRTSVAFLIPCSSCVSTLPSRDLAEVLTLAVATCLFILSFRITCLKRTISLGIMFLRVYALYAKDKRLLAFFLVFQISIVSLTVVRLVQYLLCGTISELLSL